MGMTVNGEYGRKRQNARLRGLIYPTFPIPAEDDNATMRPKTASPFTNPDFLPGNGHEAADVGSKDGRQLRTIPRKFFGADLGIVGVDARRTDTEQPMFDTIFDHAILLFISVVTAWRRFHQSPSEEDFAGVVPKASR